MSNLVGNAPNQVPTNADLGDLAYQDADYVRVGDIRVDGGITANTITAAGASAVTITGELSVTSNLSVSGNTTLVEIHIVSANLSVSSGNVNITTGNINVTNGNIYLNTSTPGFSPNTVVTRGYLDTQLIVFGF